MAPKTQKSGNKEILKNFLNKLVPVLSRNQRTLLAESVEQIIDNFGLDYSIEEFTSDRRYSNGSMGRKSGKYFMRNQTTGEYVIGTVKDIANVLECTPASLYIAIRRSSDKGEEYTHKRGPDGLFYRINECGSTEEVKLDVHFAEQLKKEYKERLKHKEKYPHVNENGSY